MRARAYLRLSREDLKRPGTLEDKWELRRTIARTIAAEHGLELADDDIVTERESGSKLSNREGLLGLLSLARQGMLPALITPYIDRLLRGDKADEQAIEDALCVGRTILYHTEGAPVAFGPDYDPLLFEVKSLVARTELRGMIRKRRETDRARVLNNMRTRSFAPYGYRHIREVRDGLGNLISEWRLEVIPEEWAIVLECFARYRGGEGTGIIAADLNRRHVPTAGHGRVPVPASEWSHAHIRSMLLNPIYAGHQSQRHRVERGKLRVLSPSEYVMALQPGNWPTALTLEEWWEVHDAILLHRVPRPASRSLLRGGMLRCHRGQPMLKRGPAAYWCLCDHPYRQINTDKIEDYARRVCEAVLLALPEDALEGQSKARDRRALDAAVVATRREEQAARAKAEDLMLRAGHYRGLFGDDLYEATARRAREEWERATAAAASASMAAQQPDVREMATLLRQIRALGLDAIWRESVRLQRQVMQGIIRQITLQPVPEGRARHCGADVALWDWVTDLCPDLVLPQLPAYRWTDARRAKGR